MLRLRGKYSLADMLMQYKTHIWGHSEFQNGCIMHASATSLPRLDSMQRRYLHELSITEESAFIEYNFAPPCLRRDVGILGLIHKRVLGLAHPAYEEMLPWAGPEWYRPPCMPKHSKQLDGKLHQVIFRHGMYNRSIFGMVHVYNRLSQRLVDCDNLKLFQRELTAIAKTQCERGD